MGGARGRARYPGGVKADRFKIGWIVVSVPTVVVAEVEGTIVAGVLLTIVGWGVSHWLALRG